VGHKFKRCCLAFHAADAFRFGVLQLCAFYDAMGYFGIEAFRGGSMGGFHFSEALCSSLPYKRLIASRNDSAATARQKYFEKRRIIL
jgi:hypothetical protein